MPQRRPEWVHVRGLEERAFNAWPALQTVVTLLTTPRARVRTQPVVADPRL